MTKENFRKKIIHSYHNDDHPFILAVAKGHLSVINKLLKIITSPK
ncbi:MAG: hypothetical protein AB8U25_00225 [Rickettsiales endosymbiont of Dermacentor nuttalli]